MQAQLARSNTLKVRKISSCFDTLVEKDMSSQKAFLTAEWRDLVMLNYETDPSVLLPHVPPCTELDYWNGQTFVSLIGFRFLRTKVLGVRFPFHCNFEEVNFRFYVRREESGEVKRGVVFIREIVPRWAVALIARVFYNEKYFARPMTHKIQLSGSDISATYGWKSKDAWNNIILVATGEPALPVEGSIEQFITEHYWGYAKDRAGCCIEYRVEHPQWKVWSAREARFEGETQEFYGKNWAGILTQKPASAFFASGSEVTVYRGTKIFPVILGIR